MRNANRWIEDAKLLIQNSSYGHASATLRFAIEEIARAIVCWYVSQRIFPAKGKAISDIFRSHAVKSQVVLGMLSGIRRRELVEKGVISAAEQTDQEIAEEWKVLKPLISEMEKKRQSSIYVGLNPRDRTIETPESIGEKEARALLNTTEFAFVYAKDIDLAFTEPVREKFRQYFGSLPKEVWETGRIRIN